MPPLMRPLWPPSLTPCRRPPAPQTSIPAGLGLLVLLATLYLGALGPTPARATEGAERVVHRQNSLYQFLIVIENPEKNERYLANLEKTTLYQGGIRLDAPEQLLFEYTRISFAGLAFLEQLPKEALFVGLGIGAMPRYLARHFPETSIEVAEIDPAVVDIAKEYFSFKEAGRMTVKVEDGRQFIKRAKKRYDIIFLDAYQGDTIPFHLTTREFLGEVKARLNPGGVVVSNILSPTRNKFFTAMIKTYQTEFANLAIFKGKASGNYVFVASERAVTPEALRNRSQEIQESRPLGIDLAAITQEQRVSPTPEEKAEVLSDDFAPVNLYRHMEADPP